MYRALIIFLVVAACAPIAYAQTAASRDWVTIEMSPAFPEASTPISLTVDSLSIDLERAFVRWFVNGQLITEGEGQRRITTETKGLGTKTTVVVEVTGDDGIFLTDTRVVQPAEVDIVWESDSYVPPFYRGKRLASPDGVVTAEAMPRLVRTDGSLVPARDIIFTWRKNDAIVSSVSGRGRSTATFPAPELFSSDIISVEAVSRDGNIIAAAQVLIPSADPFVLLYQDHPLFGALFHRALAPENTFSDVEASLVAVPFFARVFNADDARLQYDWSVNGASVPADTTNPSRITINAERSTGTARVGLSITHATSYIMDARGAWRLILNNGIGEIRDDPFARPE